VLLAPKFWTCKNGVLGTVGRSLAPLAGYWHVFFLADELKGKLFIRGG